MERREHIGGMGFPIPWFIKTFHGHLQDSERNGHHNALAPNPSRAHHFPGSVRIMAMLELHDTRETLTIRAVVAKDAVSTNIAVGTKRIAGENRAVSARANGGYRAVDVGANIAVGTCEAIDTRRRAVRATNRAVGGSTTGSSFTISLLPLLVLLLPIRFRSVSPPNQRNRSV